MLKNLSNLGAVLNKTKQKQIVGGKAQISSGLAYCSCSEGGNDGWDGTISSCDRCFALCMGNAICID
ncbi:hypothetical protein [uncultured Aquimarina sp.]|uniref:hypothetical protein n=1 Tax=uncultured Aquimarina sp. TaxID=575652 RepID=UPI0026255D75|nr:hypothetical protein [uncultured Aquimarina sp.]